MGTNVRQPSERLQKLLLAAAVPDPYEVTEGIVITVPTRHRRQVMADLELATTANRSVLVKLIDMELPKRPECPVMPEPPSSKLTKATYAAYESAVEQYRTLESEWERLDQEWQSAVEKHRELINSISEKMTANSEAYTKALLGNAYDDVLEFFDDQPAELWQAFQADLMYHFKLAVRPPEVPDDGTCPECGKIVDEEQAGKAPGSSA